MEKVNIKYDGDDMNIYVHTNPDDYVSETIKYYKTFFEYELLSFLHKNYSEQKNIIDIGANIGNHSLFFAKYMKCKNVYAFEPMQKNTALFNINLSAMKDKCFLYEIALSNINGKKPLYNTEINNNGGFSLNKNEKSIKVLDEIDVVKLDNFGFTDVTFIKIDVENHENEVLQGAKQTILKNKPTIILENSYYYFSSIFPDPDPHKDFFDEIGYTKIYSNLCQSSMDMWTPSIQ